MAANGELRRYMRRRAAANEVALATGMPTDEVEERWHLQAAEARALMVEGRELPSQVDRREFIRRVARLGGTLAATGTLAALAAACTPGTPDTRPSQRANGVSPAASADGVVIVGAGLAGLTAAYRLQKAGIAATVYEGSDRVGGRTRTLRDFFTQGDTAELGGETINSDQTTILKLAKELGLGVTDLWKSYPRGTSGVLWFDGEAYNRKVKNAAFDAAYPAMRRDLLAAGGWPVTYENATPDARRIDEMSMEEWIERNIDGGTTSTFGKYVDVGMTTEYGLDPGSQSSLNLLFEAGLSKPGDRKLYGYQDWRWRIEGGNDLVATELAATLPEGAIRMEEKLEAVRTNADGSTTLTFSTPSGPTHEVKAGTVIMAIPCTTLRLVDLAETSWSPLKLEIIDGLGMGTNSKLHLQFAEPVWEQQGFSGYITAERPLQSTTLVSPANGPATILDNFKGGAGGTSYPVGEPFGPAASEFADAALAEIDQIMPGSSAEWNGKAYLSQWATNPWSGGSYFCPLPGQYTTMFGAVGLPEGRVAFCGEQTDIQQFGFMDGAVRSGVRAAKETIAMQKQGA